MEASHQTGQRKGLDLVREAIVPIGSLLIALGGIALSFYSITAQRWLAEAKLKYEGYGALMGELRLACSPKPGDVESMWDHVNNAWAEYYPLETFVEMGERQNLRSSLVGVVMACEDVQHAQRDPDPALQVFGDRHKALGEQLEANLGLGRR